MLPLSPLSLLCSIFLISIKLADCGDVVYGCLWNYNILVKSLQLICCGFQVSPATNCITHVHFLMQKLADFIVSSFVVLPTPVSYRCIQESEVFLTEGSSLVALFFILLKHLELDTQFHGHYQCALMQWSWHCSTIVLYSASSMKFSMFHAVIHAFISILVTISI